jgi:hypothetical protein
MDQIEHTVRQLNGKCPNSFMLSNQHHIRMYGAMANMPVRWPVMQIVWRAAFIITLIALVGRYWP